MWEMQKIILDLPMHSEMEKRRVVTKDDQKILKAAAAEIDFMGVNYYQSCVCEYNPMDGVTPYGTMNTTGVKGLQSSA